LELAKVAEGSQLSFRYQVDQHPWRPITPLNDLENVYETTYVPSLTYEWHHEPPNYSHAKVLMETSLEGLLAGYKGDKFAPKDITELFQGSLAERMVKTDIPGQLSRWNVDEIMVPVCASVANRACLDPKFNYLTYNFVEVDWQVGNTQHFKSLVDKFYQYGLQIVPDLIFAHQVRKPFGDQGSMDMVIDPENNNNPVFMDVDAFLFRDYGTWMLNLALPDVRRMLIEKITAFIIKFRLKLIRIDYIDGLILQYSNREENHAEQFIQELKAELEHHCPDVVALGETFEVAGNPAVRNFIDVFYAPIGFSIVEELYKPPAQVERPLYPDVGVLAEHIEQVLRSDRREAFYAQLHDETWYCPHILQGRPYVPWAYGAHPAQLAKNQGDVLVEMGLLKPTELLDFVHRTVRNAEALTMFLANLRYMFVPSVDSLSLGCLDDPGQWKVTWEGIAPNHMRTWQKTGLSRREILDLHKRHRADMVKLREIFRQYTKVDPVTSQPLVHPQVNQFDQGSALLSLFRCNLGEPDQSLLVIFNFGAENFHGDIPYEIPVPEGFTGTWELLFDGEQEFSQGFPGDFPEPEQRQQFQTTGGQYSNQSNVLRLNVGARSLVVLKYQGR
jgi:1,4-alpha-glucan branching enzyme